MNYINYFFGLIFSIMFKIQIPIPVSSDKVFYFNIFSIVIIISIFLIIIYFISKLMDIDISNFVHFLYERRNESAIKTYKAVHRIGKKSYSDVPDMPKYFKDKDNVWRKK